MLKQMENNSTPLVFFDPQYRQGLDKLNYGNEGARQKERALLAQMFETTIQAFIDEIYRILKPSGYLMLWVDKFLLCEGYKHLLNHSGVFEENRLQTVDLITWNKMRIGMGYRTRRTSEYLLVIQKQPIKAKATWSNHSIPDVWNEKIFDKVHPHQKPKLLIYELINATTKPGDLVVDPAAGSYEVMNIALRNQRDFMGCDLI